MLAEARSKSHNAYRIKSAPTMMGGTIENVWGSDKIQAIDILIGFSELIYKTKSCVSQENKGNEANRQRILQKVFSNPQELMLLLELLGVARDSLLSQPVKETSNIYKEEIRGFMQKYSEYHFFNIPEGYREERDGLTSRLNTLIREATGSIKEELVAYAERQYPQNKILLERLNRADNLFGSLSITNIHPLRNPDYE